MKTRIPVASPARFLSSLGLTGLLVSSLLIISSRASTPWAKDTTVDHVDETTIYFRPPTGAETPPPLKTPLHELKYLATFTPSRGGLPYFLVTGRPCHDCLQDKGVYFFRPGGA